MSIFIFLFLSYSVFDMLFNDNNHNENIQKQNVEEYRKYSKNIKQKFVLDSTEFEIVNFIYKPEDKKTNLRINILIKNISESQQILTSEHFKLLSEDKIAYLPIIEPINLRINAKTFIKLDYILPARKLPYLAYFLNIIKSNDKAIISISKSYRSEG